MPEDLKIERRLAAVLAADVAGYGRLTDADEAGTLRALAAQRAILDDAISRHRGRIANTAGDSVLAEFPSAVDAVECAIDAQRTLCGAASGADETRRVLFRIGIHVGDVAVRGDDLLGGGVNVAARLEGLAEPGGIVISGAAHEQVKKILRIDYVDLGAQTLKNIEEPVRAFAIAGARSATQAIASAALVHDDGKPLPLPDKPSIAVLPFQNMSGDPEQEYFADGMVEDIITAFSRIRWLFVIARNSSFTYKGRAIDIKQVARELGVRYVLEGSVRKGGNRVRVTAQLIDATTGAHIWAERYDRDLNDIFAVQDEITAGVAGVIEPALAEAEQQRALRKPPERLDAWEAYQRGVWHFNKYGAEENRTALAFFRQAIALDTRFAPAHYGYSLALQWEAWFYSSRAITELQGEMLEEARIAVSLDDKDAMAHAVLAHARMACGEREAAVAEVRTALSLNPNNAFVIGMVGCVLAFDGNHEEALARLQQARRASPHDPLIWLWTFWSGITQFYGRQFDTAVKTFGEVLRLRPGNTDALWLSAASFAFLQRPGEARDRLKLALAQPRVLSARQQLPWERPEDYALRIEGVRLARTAE